MFHFHFAFYIILPLVQVFLSSLSISASHLLQNILPLNYLQLRVKQADYMGGMKLHIWGKTGLHIKTLVVLVNEHAHLRKGTALKSARGLINNSGLWLLQLLLWMIPVPCTVRELGKISTRPSELLAVKTFIPELMRTYCVS